MFDSAALAVPAFVAAALLQDWQQKVRVDGRTLVVRRAAATDPGVLLALARVHPDGAVDLFPDGDDQCCASPSKTRQRPPPATASGPACPSPAGSPAPGRCCSPPMSASG